jgi:putative transposase
LKTLIRKAEPRTFDAVSDALKNALAELAPSECANYLRNAGYAYT